MKKIDAVEAIEQGIKAAISVVGDRIAKDCLFLPDLVPSTDKHARISSALIKEKYA